MRADWSTGLGRCVIPPSKVAYVPKAGVAAVCGEANQLHDMPVLMTIRRAAVAPSGNPGGDRPRKTQRMPRRAVNCWFARIRVSVRPCSSFVVAEAYQNRFSTQIHTHLGGMHILRGMEFSFRYIRYMTEQQVLYTVGEN